MGVTEHEQQEVVAANALGRTPVVFVHGLWLLPSSWDRWQTLFRGGRLRDPCSPLAR